MTDLLKTIRVLMMDPNAMTRLFAIDLLIQNQHRFEPDTVIDVLQSATNDREDEVARHAKLSMSKLLQWGFSGEEKLRELGIHSRMTDLSEFERIRENDVRRGGLQVLQPVLTALRQLIPAHPLAPQALLALGQLRDPASVNLMIDSLANPTLREKAFEALKQYKTPEIRALIGRMIDREKDDTMLARSVDILGEFESADTLDELTRLASSQAEMVRERVALSLGKLPRRAGEPVLLEMWHAENSSEVQLAILTGLGRAGRDEAADAIGRRLGALSNDKVLSKAMIALGRIGSAKAFPYLVQALPSEHPRVRANALEGISRLPVSAEEVLPVFTPYLRDKNNRVRGNAIMAVFPHDHQRALAELRQMMSSDKASDRATSAWIASQIQNVEAVEALVILTNTELDKNVHASCLASVAQLRNPRVRAVLQRLLAHPSNQVRIHAISAYARVGGPAVLRELETLYQQSDNELIKGTIVTAMGGISHQGNLTFLQRKLGDSSERVVANAIEALDEVGGLEVAVMVGPFVGHGNPRIRANAVVTLWNLGHLSDATELARMLGARDEAAVRSALFAIGRIAENFSWRQMEKRPLLLSELSQRLQDLPPKDDLSTTFAMEVPLEEETDESSAEELQVLEALGSHFRAGGEQVRDRLGAVLEQFPKSTGAHFMLSRLTAAAADRHEPPDQVVDEAKFLYLLSERLKVAKSRGDIDSVLENYFEIFALHLEMLEEFVRIGRKYLKKREGSGAGAIARFIVSQLQWTEDLHRRLGILYMVDKDYDRAHTELWKACLNTPEDGGAMLDLARASAVLGKRKLAQGLVELILESELVDARIKAKASRLAEKLAS